MFRRSAGRRRRRSVARSRQPKVAAQVRGRVGDVVEVGFAPDAVGELDLDRVLVAGHVTHPAVWRVLRCRARHGDRTDLCPRHRRVGHRVLDVDEFVEAVRHRILRRKIDIQSKQVRLVGTCDNS